MGADPLMEAAKRISERNAPTEPEQPVKAETAEETPKGDTESDGLTYTVKVNGEEIEVPLDELKLGYMREADYRQKTSKAAEMRKDLESKLSALDEKITDAETLIEIDLDYLGSEDGKRLKEEDPQEYLKRVDAVQAKADKLKLHREEKAKRAQERKAEKLKTENEKLREKISDWLDDDVKAKETREIVEYLVEKQGYTQEEIAQIDDHRVFTTAREAVKLEKLLSQDLSSKEVKKPPKSAKPGSTETKAERSKEQKLHDKLKKTGNMHDAAALFKERLFKK